jgi:DegV family protein with EDD domain
MLDKQKLLCYTHIENIRYEVKSLTKHHDNARVFTALGDVTRLKVIELLRSGGKSATELQNHTGTGQSTLSHHMKILTESGIVTTQKKGKWTYYSISENGSRYAERLLRWLTSANKPSIITKEGAQTMKKFTIAVDTSCELHPEFIKEHGIEVMPITFTLNDIEHKGGSWQEISGKEFYDSLRKGGVAKTAQINPDTFVKTFKEYAERDEDVLFLILSSGLSATFQSSQIALEEVRESYPNCNIHPVDGLSATSLNSVLAALVVKKREEGLSAAETAAFVEEKKHYIQGHFTVDDLMYLHRGGRLSKLSAIGGSILGIKPVLNIQPDGTLALKDKIRGKEAVLKHMVAQVKRSINPDTVLDTAYITHTDNENDAEKFAEMLKAEIRINNLETVMMGPVIGAHLGPGALTIAFEADITRQEYENKYYGGKKTND